MIELIDERTEYSKLFDLGNGKFTKRCFSQPTHYLSEGKWQDIEIVAEDLGDKYLSEKNKVSSGFRRDLKYYKYMGLRFDYDHQLEFSMRSIKLNGVEQIKSEGFKSIKQISPTLIIHKINENVFIESNINSTNTSIFAIVKNPIESFYMKEEIHLKGFNYNGKLDTFIEDNIKIESEATDKYYYFNKPIAFDSLDRSIEGIKHKIVKRDNKLYYIKEAIDLDDFYTSLYPIRIDGTAYYSTTADGYIGNTGGDDETWSSVRGAGTGDESNTGGNTLSMDAGNTFN